jgi:hypothetical protein
MRQAEHQQTAYNGLGLKPEEYCVMVVVAEHQERLARQAETEGNLLHDKRGFRPKSLIPAVLNFQALSLRAAAKLQRVVRIRIHREPMLPIDRFANRSKGGE